MNLERWRRWVLGALAVIAVILTLEFLHTASVFFVPTLFAVYIVLMVLPVHQWLASQLPDRLRGLATLITALLPVLVLAIFVVLTWWVIRQVSSQGSQWGARFQQQWESIRSWLEGQGVAVDQLLDQESASALFSRLIGPLTSLLTSTASLLLGIALVLFLVVLLVSERTAWKHKTEATLEQDESEQVLDIARETAHKVRLFLLWRTATGLISALLVAGLTWGLGVALVPLWFLLQWLLNYIPNIGSIIAGIFPVVFAFVQNDWQTGLYVLIGIFAIEQFVGNYLDPKLQGRGLSLSPAAVLIALLLFGWVWGVAGAILAAPVLATLRAVARHVPELEPLAVFIGRDPEEEDADENNDDGPRPA